MDSKRPCYSKPGGRRNGTKLKFGTTSVLSSGKSLLSSGKSLKSGVSKLAKAGKAGKAVAEDGYHLYKSDDYKRGFRMGDPYAAAEAIQVIIKRDLAQPNALDLTVFNDCPVLGCYLLTCADTSAVANMFIADIGLPGWMDRMEAMKKKQMDPLLKIASKNINSSRLQLEGLASDKGTHIKKGFFAGIKSKAIKQLGLS